MQAVLMVDTDLAEHRLSHIQYKLYRPKLLVMKDINNGRHQLQQIPAMPDTYIQVFLFKGWSIGDKG